MSQAILTRTVIHRQLFPVRRVEQRGSLVSEFARLGDDLANLVEILVPDLSQGIDFLDVPTDELMSACALMNSHLDAKICKSRCTLDNLVVDHFGACFLLRWGFTSFLRLGIRVDAELGTAFGAQICLGPFGVFFCVGSLASA